jgi:spore coat polysaccharide biosynthesis protein SpsF
VLDEAIDVFARGGCDVVSNTWRASYPQGIDAQVFAWSLLDEAARLTGDRAHREHVSLYFYEHPERYRICHVTAPPAYRRPGLRCQLDTPEDLEFVRAIYGELFDEHPAFSLHEIFALLARRPELARINAGVPEKPLR